MPGTDRLSPSECSPHNEDQVEQFSSILKEELKSSDPRRLFEIQILAILRVLGHGAPFADPKRC